MGQYYRLSPEVAGGLGEDTIMDRTHVPPIVSRLHYVFDGWLGDDIVESYPCFIVTGAVAERLQQSNANGFTLREVEVSTSDEFKDQSVSRDLPIFRWLDVTGIPGKDDFGLDTDGRLVVSDRVLTILREEHLEHCLLDKYP